MRATASLLHALAAEGVRHVFTVAGGRGERLFSDPDASGVRPVAAAQAAGAACMADGYARASGRFGVCFGGEDDAAAMVAAAAAARADGSPVLYVTTPTAGPGGPAPSPLAPVLAASPGVGASRPLLNELRFALARLLAGSRGPVPLCLPPEAEAAGDDAPPAAWTPLDASAYRPCFVDAPAVERLWRVLVPQGGGAASRMAVLAGPGVEKAAATRRLLAFAEQFEVPVATTVRGKGAFPEDHRLCLGVYGGGGGGAADALLAQPLEVLIVLGCGLRGEDGFRGEYLAAPGRTLVQVDADPAVIGSAFPVDVPVVGDCRAALELMLEGGSARVNRLRAGNQARAAWVLGLRDAARPFAQARGADDAPASPAAVAAALRRALPREGCLVVDAGPLRPFFTHGFPVVRPCAYFTPASCAPAGWAVAAAVGVKAAVGRRPVACVTDARGLLALGTEVATASRRGLPVCCVALVADGADWVPDFAAFGRSLGARGLSVARAGELEAALAEGLSGSGPCVAAVRCDMGAHAAVNAI